MIRSNRLVLGMLLVCLLVFFSQRVAAQDKPAAAKPNIVYIIADDQGWGDAQCNNPDSPLPTPGINRIAREGMRFTDAHSASAVCTPTRYALLTGRYAWRTKLQKGVLVGDKDPLIAEDTLTIGGLLKAQGYKTACIGKWHLGFKYEFPKGQKSTKRKDLGNVLSVPVGTKIIGGPTTRGFDTFLGFHHAREMATWMVDDEITENIHVQQMLPRITHEAVDYIGERGSKKDGPFFLYVPLSSPHTPIVPDDAWQGKSKINAYADFVMQTDDTVVRVLKALDEAGLTENTLVIFTADNGTSPRAEIPELKKHGHDPLARLRGHKADIWEGGHRVPFVVRWPGVVEPGAVTDEPICLNSLMATSAAILGVELAEDQGVDSFSILPVLRGEKINEPTHPIIVHHSISGKFAARIDDWKYIAAKNSGGWSKGGDNKPFQLYNMLEDRNETTNLIDEKPEVAKRVRELLEMVIANGRSTPGPEQSNDVKVQYP